MEEPTEEEQMEMLGAMYEIAKERSDKAGIDMTDVNMTSKEIMQRIKERRLR